MTKHQLKVEEILRKLISFNTVSSESNLELISFIETSFSQLGIQSTRVVSDDGKKSNIFASIGPTDTAGVILSGHTDVVPTSKNWSTDPFVATIKDEKVFGRGTCDMKGFIACTLAYAPIFSKTNLDRDIHFSFTFDEETACQGAPLLINELKRKGMNSGICIVGEPT